MTSVRERAPRATACSCRFRSAAGHAWPAGRDEPGNCETLPLGQTYGFGFGEEGTRWGGFLSDRVRVPFADAMLIPVPEGLASDLAASASDNITDAYRTSAPS